MTHWCKPVRAIREGDGGSCAFCLGHADPAGEALRIRRAVRQGHRFKRGILTDGVPTGGHYDMGLGAFVRDRGHRRQLCREKRLEPCG